MPCSKRPVHLPNGTVAELREDLTSQCLRRVLAELRGDGIAVGCTFRGSYPPHGGPRAVTLDGRVLCGAHARLLLTSRCRDGDGPRDSRPA